MNKLALFPIIGLAGIVSSCSSSDDKTDEPTSGDTVTVEITIQVITRSTVTTELGNGAEMNVFAKTYGRPDAPDMVSEIKAVNNNGTWSLSPEVNLQKGQNAFIYAVAPYNAANTDVTAIPVDITQQIDLLYSGEYVPVSFTTHTARLNMKHALALAAFNIITQGYSGEGLLNSLSINGEQVYTRGTMSAATGKITPTGKDDFAISLAKKITSTGWTQELPRMWTIPFSTKVKDATLIANIDGKTYTATFPEVEMKSGYQYIFRMVLTDIGLEFIVDQVETISLNKKDDTMSQLEGYGTIGITLSASTSIFEAPTFNGDNVFGTIDWGDGCADSYKVGNNHSYTSQEVHNVTIESWNSTGFELENLSGVEVVDISQY